MVPLVRLNDVPIERRGRVVASARTEPNELVVAYDGERLARELTGGDAFDRRRERLEVNEHRRPRLRVEATRVDAQLAEALLDEAKVLGLVAGLPREGELHVDLCGRRDPTRRALGRFDL